jgi:hypothetical protein
LFKLALDFSFVLNMDTADRIYPWTILLLEKDLKRAKAVRQKILSTWPNSKIEILRDATVKIDWAGVEMVISNSEFLSTIEWIKNATLIPTVVYSEPSSLNLSQLLGKKSCFHQLHGAFSTLLKCSFSSSLT